MNFGALKINLSSVKVLEKSWKLVSEKGYEPCMQQNANIHVALDYNMKAELRSFNKLIQSYWRKHQVNNTLFQLASCT